MFLLLSVLVAGAYLGFAFRDEIQSACDVHAVFQKAETLRNTVLPTGSENLIPRAALEWLETAKFIVEFLWVAAEQHLYRSCMPLDSGLYRVSYIIEGKPYSIVVRPVRGPENWLILTDNEPPADATARVAPFLLGIQSLVHDVTPRMLGETQPLQVLQLGVLESDRTIQPDQVITAEPL